MPKKRIKKATKKNPVLQEKNREVKTFVDRLPNGRFPPGVSGNTNGAPKGGFTIRTMLKNQGMEIIEIGKGKNKRQMERLTAFLLSMWDDAIFRHDSRARDQILERLYGKVALPFIN